MCVCRIHSTLHSTHILRYTLYMYYATLRYTTTTNTTHTHTHTLPLYTSNTPYHTHYTTLHVQYALPHTHSTCTTLHYTTAHTTTLHAQHTLPHTTHYNQSHTSECGRVSLTFLNFLKFLDDWEASGVLASSCLLAVTINLSTKGLLLPPTSPWTTSGLLVVGVQWMPNIW